MAKVIIFGDGEIASIVHYYLKHDSPHDVVAFSVDEKHIKTPQYEGLPIVAFEEITANFPPSEYEMFVALSYKNMNHLRALKYAEAKAKGYTLISYVSPKTFVWPNLTMGDNCFIFENNVIQPFVKLGSNIIIWSGNHIGHHSEVGDNTFIASHAVVSGGVKIEPNCFIGVNATIRDHVTIASECLIGAGALILKSTEPKGVYSSLGSKKVMNIDQLRKI